MDEQLNKTVIMTGTEPDAVMVDVTWKGEARTERFDRFALVAFAKDGTAVVCNCNAIDMVSAIDKMQAALYKLMDSLSPKQQLEVIVALSMMVAKMEKELIG